MPSILCTQIILNFQCFIFSCREHVISKIALHNGFRALKVFNLIVYLSYISVFVLPYWYFTRNIHDRKTILMKFTIEIFKFYYSCQKTYVLHRISLINNQIEKPAVTARKCSVRWWYFIYLQVRTIKYLHFPRVIWEEMLKNVKW